MSQRVRFVTAVVAAALSVITAAVLAAPAQATPTTTLPAQVIAGQPVPAFTIGENYPAYNVGPIVTVTLGSGLTPPSTCVAGTTVASNCGIVAFTGNGTPIVFTFNATSSTVYQLTDTNGVLYQSMAVVVGFSASALTGAANATAGSSSNVQLVLGTGQNAVTANFPTTMATQVIFSANQGVGSMLTQTVIGSGVTLSSNGFTRSGYTFTGWNTAANGSGTSYGNAAAAPTSNTTLYAQWSSGSGSSGSASSGTTSLAHTGVQPFGPFLAALAMLMLGLTLRRRKPVAS